MSLVQVGPGSRIRLHGAGRGRHLLPAAARAQRHTREQLGEWSWAVSRQLLQEPCPTVTLRLLMGQLEATPGVRTKVRAPRTFTEHSIERPKPQGCWVQNANFVGWRAWSPGPRHEVGW